MGAVTDKNMTKMIMFALFSGVILGLILFYTGHGDMAEYIKPLGDIFIKFLKMMIIPLVMSSIFVAMVNLGTPEELGSIGLKALIYYFTTTVIAVAIGLIVVNIINPGIGVDIGSVGAEKMSHALTAKLSGSAETGLLKTILGVITNAIPTNPFHAMANSVILQVIFFSLMFGITALFYKEEAEPFVKFMKSLESLSMGLTHGLMKFAPYGIFALMLHVIATTGFGAISALAKYMLTVIVGLTLHFIVLLLIGVVRTRMNPIFILKGVIQSILTAFSTASSAATLPITMANVEDNLGVNKKTAQFILPLGATVNMDGTALYESIAVIFIGQAYGLDISIGQQMIIFMTASVAAIGAAAIPGAGLVTMSIVLSAVGFPLEGIGLILAVDRVLDMFRTSVNVFGDCIGTIVIDSFNKEKKRREERLRIKIIIFFLILVTQVTWGKVDPPNYDFSIDKFNDFMPGKKISSINKKYKNTDIVFKEGAFVTYKYYVEHIRYRFPILVQSINGIVTDFYARLPYYFLHDIFHQSLINRYGPQDFYQKTEESAIYVWKNKKNLKHIYSGTCTITCFPIFYSVIPVKHKYGQGFEPIIKKMQKNSKN